MGMANIDSMLIDAISGRCLNSPRVLRDIDARRKVLEEIDYHGVSGLLVARAELCERWPEDLVTELRNRARGHAMWELQHRTVLTRLLTALASRGIVAILLKGSAIAYDLYEEPAARFRGDTDIFVSRTDVPMARSVLEDLGFAPYMAASLAPEAVRLQELWNIRTSDGNHHSIDLHWSVLNSPMLVDMFTEAECRDAARPLPRLCETALALDRLRMLVHACVHRQLHAAAPYFVEDRTYYGGDRLIWFKDMFLLANSFSEQEWGEFLAIADEKGVTDICLDAVALAYSYEGRPLPEAARPALQPAKRTPAMAYLRASQSKRALMDLRAVGGMRSKFAYLAAQAAPSEGLIRAKYPRMRHLPVSLLYARRFLELLLPRPRHGRG